MSDQYKEVDSYLAESRVRREIQMMTRQYLNFIMHKKNTNPVYSSAHIDGNETMIKKAKQSEPTNKTHDKK